MEHRKIRERITKKILLELYPHQPAADRKFTRAAHHCGMSRNQLKRIYMSHWVIGMARSDFAKLILSGKLKRAKDALGGFYSVGSYNWYHRKDGTMYYFRGQFKGKVVK